MSDKGPSGWGGRLRAALPYLIGVGVLIALVLAVQPGRFAFAASRFTAAYAPLVAFLCLAYYFLQGVRWQPLLRAVGVTLPLRDTVILNMAGQAAGLLPGGELTRAVLVSEVSHGEVGATIATVTVQELIYFVLLIAAAVPGALHHSFAAIGVSVALAGVLAITAVLTLQPVFQVVEGLVRRIPLARRFHPDLVELQRDTVVLLHRWDTLYWSALSALQAAGTITMFWLVIQAVDPGKVSWPDAAFAYAVASIAGALSLGPGGLGGFEAAGVGMLVVVGVPFQIAVAATILQRVADKGLATVYGAVAYLYARRHYDLSQRQVIRHGERRGRQLAGTQQATR